MTCRDKRNNGQQKRYRRANTKSGTCFFTVNLAELQLRLLVDYVAVVWAAVKLTAHGSALAETLRAAQREPATRRAKVAHVFRDLKIRFGNARVRYRRLAKNLGRFVCLAALSNVLTGDSHVRRQVHGAP